MSQFESERRHGFLWWRAMLRGVEGDALSICRDGGIGARSPRASPVSRLPLPPPRNWGE